MVPQDVTFLSDLWVAAWRTTMPAIDFEGRRPWLATLLGRPACKTLVAEAVHGPVGFAATEAGYLHQLVIAPSAMGTGVASCLLTAAKARSDGRVTLDVNQENPRAVRFYKREGFEIEAEGVNPRSGRPTWRMVWRAGSCLTPAAS